LKIINFAGFMSRYMLGKDDLLKAKVVRIRTFIRFLDKENFLDYENDISYWSKMGIDPCNSSTLRPDVWYINQKVEENKYFVEFELSNALDLEGAKLPRRQIINNYCTWKYRGKNCPYSGGAVADYNNVKFDQTGMTPRGEWASGQAYSQKDTVYLVTREGSTTRNIVYVCTEAHTSSSDKKPSVNSAVWATDACSKTLKGCKLRFGGGPDDALPFGGFPASRIY
jgi:phage-related protein